MKYTLTITDATPEELAALIRNLPGNGEGQQPPLTGTISMQSASTAAPPMPDVADPSADDETSDTPAPDGAVDTDGLPWDARIHSAAKTQTKAGAWRKAKGADAATIAAVEAELRARGPDAAPTPPAPPVMPTMPVPLPAPVPMTMPTPEPVAPPPADRAGYANHAARRACNARDGRTDDAACCAGSTRRRSPGADATSARYVRFHGEYSGGNAAPGRQRRAGRSCGISRQGDERNRNGIRQAAYRHNRYLRRSGDVDLCDADYAA